MSTFPQAPTRQQLLTVGKDLHAFAHALRAMAAMDPDQPDPGWPEFAAALRVVGNTLDNAAIKISNDDPAVALAPGDTLLTDMAAMLLGSLWDSGREGFQSSLDLVVQAAKMEGKS